MKKLSILLAGVCLTAALYSAGTTYGQNKTLIPDLIIQLITVVIGVVLYTAIFKIVKNVIRKIIH